MPLDTRGRWYPSLSPKQLVAYNDNRIYQLLSGPRACGKTIVALHKAVKHAWAYDHDRVGLFVRSMKLGKIGIFDDLTSYILPAWEEGLADEGFEVIDNKIDGTTRMHYITIRNRHGGTSQIELHALHFDDDVSAKLRGSRFGCIFFDEADNWESPDVFRISAMQLRMIGLTRENHLWLGTCNPSDDEHWLHKVWYQDATSEVLAGDPNSNHYQKNLGLHEFTLLDNIYLEQAVIDDLKNFYAADPELYDRYVRGLWVPRLGDVLMAGAFKPAFHVRGNLSTNEVILPSDGCQELYFGYDLGDRNSAIILLEKVVTPQGHYWTVLDEIVHIAQDTSIDVIVNEVDEIMLKWNRIAGKQLYYIHYSDRSAIDRYRSAADATDQIRIMQLSNGRIELKGVPKPPGSVQQRINLARQLFIANRLYISTGSPKVIDCLKRVSRGKTKSEPIKRDARGSIHIFDALTYALFGEEIDRVGLTPMRPRLADIRPFSQV